ERDWRSRSPRTCRRARGSAWIRARALLGSRRVGIGDHDDASAEAAPCSRGVLAHTLDLEGIASRSLQENFAMLRYYAAACQTDFENPTDRAGIAEHARRMLAMIDLAVEGYRPLGPVKLVVFPEFAHCAPIYTTVSELLARLALPIPNEHTE